MLNGIDLSNFSGAPDIDALRAVVCSQDIARITIAMQFAATYDPWYDDGQQLGIGVNGYAELYNDGRAPYSEQVKSYLAGMGGRPIGEAYLAVENEPAAYVSEPELLAALDVLRQAGIGGGIYTRAEYWQRAGNPQLGRLVRLWDAAYDGVADLAPVNYGGWLTPHGKQYQADFRSYGLTFDLNVWGF